MTNMQGANRVLEVACGPGKHSQMLAQNFLKQKSVLVSCDFSGAMVNKLYQNYAESNNDYSKVEGNKFLIDTKTNYNEFADDTNTILKNHFDVEKIITEQGDFRKLVLGCQANNEILPFPNDSFEAYIANLSVMLVNNPKN